MADEAPPPNPEEEEVPEMQQQQQQQPPQSEPTPESAAPAPEGEASAAPEEGAAPPEATSPSMAAGEAEGAAPATEPDPAPASDAGPPKSSEAPPTPPPPSPSPPPPPPGETEAEPPLKPSSSASSVSSQSSVTSRKKGGSRVSQKSKVSTKPGGSGGQKRKKGEKVTVATARFGVLGAGKIAEAMIRGMVTHAKVSPKMIHVASKSGRSLDTFKQLGCRVTRRFYDVFGKFDCDFVVLALHGFAIRECYKLGGTRPLALTTNYIPNQRHPLFLLSLVGGVTLLDIKNTLLNPDHPEQYQLEMHRCAVNTAIAAGNGLAAIDVEPDSKRCSPIFRNLLVAFAKLEFVPESHMDVVCAVAGNGLAFHYYFINAISEGGMKMGLPKGLAVRLAAKVLKSASASLIESGKHPSDLRDMCISPSGPAIYGVHVLDKQDCASGVAGAIEAAHKRIKELAEVPHNAM